MWEYEHAVETSADPATLWRYWSDVTTWTQWNSGVRTVTIDGPFAAGTTFTMTAPDGDPIRMTLSEVVPGEQFTDVMDGGDIVVTTVHRIEPTGEGRSRVVYRTEITGSAADVVGPELGPAITADFPEVLDALVSVASGAEA
ncbi:MAG: SRPBCC family protein [Streptomyces sp.]|uniref:SRPBCC family protein n=1 Tax=Streptomyces sp. TaxID=1931 RepID=UPI0025CC84B4|nr:SRPBCC family protein [Streptomyces sp.]MBW8801759.1 SRPBCC family protein [Streptomyces sp.]